MKTKTIALVAPMLMALALPACQADDSRISHDFRIDPICVDDAADIPDGAWACSESLVVDCNDEDVPDTIYVATDGGSCDELALAEVEGPFPPGEYDIVIVDENSDDVVCATELTVTDTVAPVVETRDHSLWPPNHKYHELSVLDCIDTVDDCDDDWTAVIDFVSSDEPDDSNGDGNTDADIVLLAPDAVQLRSERQGGSNGRVYTIGFTVTDHAGNETASSCLVVVDHDKGNGAAIDDGEAWRVEPS